MCVLGVQYKRPCEVQSQETLPFTSKNKQAGRLYPRASVFQSGQSGIKLVCARVRERVHMCVCVCTTMCVCLCACVWVCNMLKYAYTLIIHIFTGANPEQHLQLHIVSVTSPFSLLDDSLTWWLPSLPLFLLPFPMLSLLIQYTSAPPNTHTHTHTPLSFFLFSVHGLAQ